MTVSRAALEQKIQLQRTALDERGQLSNLTQIEELALARILKQPYAELVKPLKAELYDSIMLHLTGEETLSLPSRIWNLALSLIFSTGLTDVVDGLKHQLLNGPKVLQLDSSDSPEKQFNTTFTMEFHHSRGTFPNNPLVEEYHKLAEAILEGDSAQINISDTFETK